MDIVYRKAKTAADLEAILRLQQANVPNRLTPNEISKEGFVTARHTLALLEKMNQPISHIIAVANGAEIAGYALVMLQKMRYELPVLMQMFAEIDRALQAANSPITDRYVVMGQVCVAKAYRRQGVFRKLYQTLLQQIQPTFDYLVTMIAAKNTRSMEAHQAIGFRELTRYHDKKGDTLVIVWMPTANVRSHAPL